MRKLIVLLLALFALGAPAQGQQSEPWRVRVDGIEAHYKEDKARLEEDKARLDKEVQAFERKLSALRVEIAADNLARAYNGKFEPANRYIESWPASEALKQLPHSTGPPKQLAQSFVTSSGVTPPAVNLVVQRLGDSLTALGFTDPMTSVSPQGVFRNGSNSGDQNATVAMFGQPWAFGPNYGVGGEACPDMQQRMTDPIASAIAAAATPGVTALAIARSGTNDIGNLASAVSVLAACIQNLGEQFEAAGNRAIYYQTTGIELWTASDVQRTIDLNAAMLAYTQSHSPAVGKPLWVAAAAPLWWNTPDPTITDGGLAASQTASAGVPMTLTGAGCTSGRKVRFTLATSPGIAQPVSIVGTLAGNPVSETTTISTGKKLWVSRYIYDTITSITFTNTVTGAVQAGCTGITMCVDCTYDGTHESFKGAALAAPALYNTIYAAYPGLIPVAKAGTNILLNPTFATASGGSCGAGITVNGGACSSGVVPQSWTPSNSDTSNISTADWVFTPNSAKATVVAGPSTTGGIKLQNTNPSTAFFTPGDKWNAWSQIVVSAGAANIKELTVQFVLAYSTITPSISSIAWSLQAAPFSGGISDITLAAPHGLTVGDIWPATVSGVTPSTYNAVGAFAFVTGASTLRIYNAITSNPGAGSGGTIALGGSLLFYADRALTSAVGMPLNAPAADQTFTFRFPDMRVQGGITLNSVNYFTNVNFSGASSGTFTFSNFHLGKQ